MTGTCGNALHTYLYLEIALVTCSSLHLIFLRGQADTATVHSYCYDMQKGRRTESAGQAHVYQQAELTSRNYWANKLWLQSSPSAGYWYCLAYMSTILLQPFVWQLTYQESLYMVEIKWSASSNSCSPHALICTSNRPYSIYKNTFNLFSNTEGTTQ